jgi:NitT/TauT family transport system ATP-binding protein
MSGARNVAPLPLAAASPRSRVISFDSVGLDLAGRTILENIDLEVFDGEFLCVVGPSGCGKTTLLRLVAGLFRPSRGTIAYQGRPVTGPRRDIALVFQDYGNALLPWRTVAANISLALEAIGVPRAERPDRIAALLTLVGLGVHADKYPNQLSGGMQQRVQIARCLAQQPNVLLMDEPFGALDTLTRESLQDELLRIVETTRTTVFFVTHDLEEAIYLGDRVVALWPNPGRVARTFKVDLPRPRNQLSTPEHPRFVQLRRELFQFIKGEPA